MERARSGALDAVLIAGPTASGKSALAILLADLLGGVVVNADSMQVYADLRVLSARPSMAEEAQVPHRLFGFVPGGAEYSVGDYARDCAALLAGLHAEGRVPIIVGGTGLYFRALTEGLVATPEIPGPVRARIEAFAAAGGDLHAQLKARDPDAAARLNPADTPRLMRALEVVEATGQPLAMWQARAQGAPLLAPGRWQGVFLNPDRSTLIERIDRRFLAMMDEGALDEVRALASLGLPANRGVMKAHGVPHLLAHLAGGMTLEAAIALGQGDTRRYAKRQMTWARKFMTTGWLWVPEAGAIAS